MRTNKKGFTLVEVIVVLVILAILIAIAVPAVMKYIDDANDTKILAQARPVLNAAKAKSVNLYADGTLNTLPNDEKLHKMIMEIAETDGELISIELNSNKTSSGDFIVKIQDRYIHYNDEKQTFTFIDDPSDINIHEKVKDALLSDDILNVLLEYFNKHNNTNNLDSEGPNYGIPIKKELEKEGIDPDAYSFRIWRKTGENTITIGTPKLDASMAGKKVNVTRYDFGNSLDFNSTPKVFTAEVEVELIEVEGKTYPVYLLRNAVWTPQS